VAIPIRRRTICTTACLKMLLAYGKLDNEILLCLDRPDPFVKKWTQKHNKWLSEHGIKVLESPFKDKTLKDQFGTAHASNFAWKNASKEWLICMDDDMYCAKDWDYNLARRIRDIDVVYVPVNVVPEIAVDRTADWGEWYHLTYPKELTYGNKYKFTVKEKEWISWAEGKKESRVYREDCGERVLGHWMPLVIHRNVFSKSGGFKPGVGRDINFDTKLGSLGYEKTVVRDSLFLHAKGHHRVGTMIMNVTAPNIPLGCDDIEQ
jgi:glycosyltransferase involved in cell wall biosynthesis